jgi:hypothetical protein
MTEPSVSETGFEVVGDGIKPTLAAVATLRNEIDISFDRGDMQGVLIETSVDGGTWNFAGKYFVSPATLTIKNPAGLPRFVEVRARYIRDLLPVGQDSDAVSVVITP